MGIFIEIYHTIGAQLVKSTFLTDVEIMTVFLSPIGRQEIEDLKSGGIDLREYLCQIMLHKQLVRARCQGKTVNSGLVKEALSRSRDSFSEMASACKYSHVIVNHDGEGSLNWHRLPSGVFITKPEGDAGRAVTALVHVLVNSDTIQVEKWNTLRF
jgi:hypothetical protein